MKIRTRYRTHTCGELRATDAGKLATVCGFCERAASAEGGFDLRDAHGKTRVTLGAGATADLRARVKDLGPEDVVQVTGDVRLRIEPDPSVPTGDVYVAPKTLTVLSRAEPLPPGVGPGHDEADLEVRLTYRYLDLRRPVMQRRLAQRSRFMLEARSYLAAQDFVEVETPYLVKWTPEAASAFFVPARAGTSFALPQTPQVYKQLLMAAGCDRYFQITRCFRNETDLTPDRQLEFTVLDLEMAYIDEEDIYPLVDGLMDHLFRSFLGKKLETPVRRLSCAEAMLRYGTDRPDLRFGLEIEDVSAAATRWPVPQFKEALSGEGRGAVRALRVPGAARALEMGFLGRDLPAALEGKGLGSFTWVKAEEGPGASGGKGEAVRLSGPIAEALGQVQLVKDLIAATSARAGDAVLFFAAAEAASAAALAGVARLEVARALDLVDRGRRALVWVNEFPFYEFDPAANGWGGGRHPFTQPREEDVALIEKDPHKVRTKGFDLVLNGVELGAGSIRNHDPVLQERIFKMFEYDPEEIQRRFGFVLDAFKFGIPPHGGLSIGLDRLLAGLLGLDAVAEVVAFPKDPKGREPLTDSPTPIDPGLVRAMAGG